MKFLAVLIAILISQSAIAQNSGPKDAFREMMSIMKINEDNLGYQPRGYWSRYPDPQDIPFKILSFDDLMAEPQRIYDFVRNMALSVNDFMHPDYKNSNRLLKVAFYCGVQHLTAQFRCYNASLWDEVQEKEPLLNAIRDIYLKTNTEYKFNRFGQAADFPLIEEKLRKAIEPIDIKVQRVLAKTVYHLYDAYKYRQIGMRNILWKDALKCWNIRLLGETQFDGMGYYPELEDCAQMLDMNSIIYSGYKLLETSVQLSDTIIKLKEKDNGIDWTKQNMNIMTPIGRIVLSGINDDVHDYNDAVLVIDFGGNDLYKGAAGSTPSLNTGVSLLIDFEGDDKYINEDEYMPSQGAAIFGAAMLYDIKGNDTYKSKRLSQGASMLGMGILADMEGDDTYDMWTSGQGGAYFGIGLAIDNSGNDKYSIWGDGQGYGGVGGVGTLVNRTGNDVYRAEIHPDKVMRKDQDHSKDGEYNYTYCQGSGVGRRGDITDGHSWAGGIGTIIDLDGDDVYDSGNWSQACGYWYGMGFLYDGNGNDKYTSTSWSQACGAHFCISGFIDEAGDDEHVIWEESCAGMGFGHDYTVTLFLNRGGDDLYKLNGDGVGYAINKSQVFFFDTDGNDTYIRGSGRGYGWNNYDKNNPPGVHSMFHLYSDQIVFFADLNGKDSYQRMDFGGSELRPDSLMKDGATLFYPDHVTRLELASKRYFGLGKDFNNMTDPEIEFFRDKMKKSYKDLIKSN